MNVPNRLTCLFMLAHVELPVSLLSPPNPNEAAASASTSTAPQGTTSFTKEKKKKHHLTTATDPLLSELRDMNFAAVGKRLNQVARRLDEDYKVSRKSPLTMQALNEARDSSDTKQRRLRN
jgi:vacuolar protein sorting-associated protein 33A